MKPSVLDPCLFFRKTNSKLKGIQVTQVADTLGGGPELFSATEESNSKRLECEPRSTNLPVQFNGFWIGSHTSEGYTLHQKDHCDNTEEIKIFNDPTAQRK